MFPVVGNFYFKGLVVGLVGKAGQHDVVFGMDAQALCEGLRSVFLAFVGEFFRQFAHVDVEQALDQLVVFRTALAHLYGLFGNDFHIRGQFLVVVGRRVVIDTAVHFFRYDAYLSESRKPAG